MLLSQKMESPLNYKFSLTHDNLVAETQWFGDLTYKIIVDGIISQNQWFLVNSDKFPLVLVSDYTQANLNNVTQTDLQKIADQFRGEDDLFPDMTWIAIMPSDVKFEIVRLWQEHADSLYRNPNVVRNWTLAKNIISDVLTNYTE